MNDLMQNFRAMRLIEGQEYQRLEVESERIIDRLDLSDTDFLDWLFGTGYHERVREAKYKILALTDLQKAKDNFYQLSRDRSLNEARHANQISILAFATAQGIPESMVQPFLQGQAETFWDMLKLSLQGRLAQNFQQNQHDHEYRIEQLRQETQRRTPTEAENQKVRFVTEEEVQILKDEHEEQRNQRRKETESEMYVQSVINTSNISIEERRIRQKELDELLNEMTSLHEDIERTTHTTDFTESTRTFRLKCLKLQLEAKDNEYARLLKRDVTS